ncbi:MAG TPA: hypothetical protein VH061_05860 [Solirubrobacteraceae bacterium]|jgi:uncharacterized membrane protein YphA (DoxX/SURF4 family)|nr:hypothetical protein [Solirubrobacteraceae bacterium]
MAKRNAGRRGRTRKRRSSGAQATEGSAETPASAAAAPAIAEKPAARPARRQRGARRPEGPPARAHRDPGGVGERPEAPWHPWPFSELLILVGAIATIIGFTTHSTSALFAGIGSVVIGTLEFTIREHLSGYRSHGSLIAGVPTALVHGAIAFGLYQAGAPRVTWVLVPVVIDVPLYWVLFKYLKARFDDARRERVFALGRR